MILVCTISITLLVGFVAGNFNVRMVSAEFFRHLAGQVFGQKISSSDTTCCVTAAAPVS